MMHGTRRWNRDHSDELQSAWMNGTGMLVWDTVFGVWVGWNDRDTSTLRRMLRAQRVALRRPHRRRLDAARRRDGCCDRRRRVHLPVRTGRPHPLDDREPGRRRTSPAMRWHRWPRFSLRADMSWTSRRGLASTSPSFTFPPAGSPASSPSPGTSQSGSQRFLAPPPPTCTQPTRRSLLETPLASDRRVRPPLRHKARSTVAAGTREFTVEHRRRETGMLRTGALRRGVEAAAASPARPAHGHRQRGRSPRSVVSTTEVTSAEFDAFIAATGYAPRDCTIGSWSAHTPATHP